MVKLVVFFLNLMDMKSPLKFLCIAFALFAFAQCSTHSISRPQASYSSMNLNDMFDEDKVYDHLFDAEETDHDSAMSRAKNLFLDGLDWYRNKRNVNKGIKLFIESAITYPEAKTYSELGNAYLDVREYDKARQSYLVALKLNYFPLSNLYYNLAVCESMLSPKGEYNYDGAEYLEKAILNGFADKDKLDRDTRLNSVKQTAQYREMYLAHFSDEHARDQIFVDMYIQSFPELTLPYTIKNEDVYNYGTENLAYDFSRFVDEMENSSFGRDVSNEFYAIGKPIQNDSFFAVIYASVELVADTLQPVYTYLVTYTPNGQEISKILFSCNCSAEKGKSGNISASNEIVVTDFEREWDRPLKEVEIKDNHVKGFKTTGNAKYMLSPGGKIELVKQDKELSYAN